MEAQTETTKPTDLAKLKKRIKDRERRFKAATAAGKRVMIARDVLAELKAETIKPGGLWLDEELCPLGVTEASRVEGVDIRDKLLQMPSCTACAVGAVFVAATKRYDRVKLDHFVSRKWTSDYDSTEYVDLWPAFDTMASYLKRWFTVPQLQLMELAYERGSGGTVPITRDDDRAVEFGLEFGSRGGHQLECMTAIMRNIVRNNGKFIP